MGITAYAVYFDKTRLNQVLLYLLYNAIKFIPASGTISVRFFSYFALWTVVVRENI